MSGKDKKRSATKAVRAGRYDFQKAEKKWRAVWQKEGVYEPKLKGASAGKRPPFYNLMMFPYPSAEGLHVGNMYAFTGSDVYGRFMRMQGKDVFEPIGLDGFGIHSENYAMKVGTHPAKQAAVSEKRFYEQLQSIGNGFAWKERVQTYDPAYYKWTQWIFTKLFKAGLAYRKKQAVNWCPKDQTVLADEQVEGGKCERCGAVAEKRELEQWFFRITKYAEQLLQNTDKLDWTEKVRIAQRNWIGKSEGADIDFPLTVGSYSGDVVFATNNLGKLERMQRLLKIAGLNIKLKLPKDIGIQNFEVEENGSSIFENSEKKARALFGKTDLPILGEDSSLAVEGMDMDPVKVKRNALEGVSEKGLTTEQVAERMAAYYQKIAASRGGSVDAEWRNDLCLLTPEGFALHAGAIRPVALMAKAKGKIDPHLPLRFMYIPKPTGKYVADQTEKEEMLELKPVIDATKKLFTPMIGVFTTRPDTIFGATYLVLAPEHPFLSVGIDKGLIKNGEEVWEYMKAAKARSDEDRLAEGKDKTGVEIKGFSAINPATGENIPVWVADYVLGGYGTGAIMAVPAHDERDADFAKKHKLPVIQVVAPVIVLGGDSTPLEGKPVSKRVVVSAIVHDPANGKYLLLKRSNGRMGFPGGGIEKGESAEEAVVREVREETGYKNFSVKKIFPLFYGNGYKSHKDVNCFDFETFFIAELKNNDKQSLHPEDAAVHENVWVGQEEVEKLITLDHHREIWNYFQKKINTYSGNGILINSKSFDGMVSEEAKWPIAESIEGSRRVQYRLRDWLISRQRYWGPPIPMVFCEKCAASGKGERKDMPGWYAVADKDLPVKLPMVKDFRPQGTGKSPLASVKSFYETKCPACKSKARRETDVSDTFLDSAWYYLRYPSAGDKKRAWDPATIKKFFPVDMYIGGAEHSVLHLLYVRFLALALHDMKLLNFPDRGVAPEGEPFPTFRAHGLIIKEGAKMSKSKGNVVNPDEYIRKFGADTLRMYLMFLAPFEQGGDFRDQAVPGISRFLERVVRFMGSSENTRSKAAEGEKKIIHQAVKKVGEDLATLHYNTAISALMICLNGLEELGGATKETKEMFVKLLAPLAPYLSEELWRGVLGHKKTVHKEAWPKYDKDQIAEKNVTIIVQVNGKTRATIETAADITEAAARELALSDAKIQAVLDGQEPKRVIYVPGRLVNIVV